eukprot:11119618-Ditylum_brightwellii.AAC.1
MLRAHRRPSEPSPPVTRASAALQPLWATTAFSPARATNALLRAAHGARIIASCIPELWASWTWAHCMATYTLWSSLTDP